MVRTRSQPAKLAAVAQPSEPEQAAPSKTELVNANLPKAEMAKVEVVKANSTKADPLKLENPPKQDVVKTVAPKTSAKSRGRPKKVAPEKEKEVDKELDEKKQVIRPEMDFSKFKFNKVIDESIMTKYITLLGTYEGDNAVVRIDKTPFDQKDIRGLLEVNQMLSHRDFVNDIYASYKMNPAIPDTPTNLLKATVIWPANETVLAKYTHAEHILFCETPDHYLKVVEPFITNKLENEKDYNQWVYNILEGKSEAERVIYNDTDKDSGFMLVPDLKWSGDVKDLNLVAICHRRDIRSLRDLNEKHLILLKNIMTKGTEAVKNKYKKFAGQLRTYIHYHPSFYHFHVHFKIVDPSDYKATDRDNLLSTVINNITLLGDYYKKSTLTYPLSLSNPLYQALKQAKRV